MAAQPGPLIVIVGETASGKSALALQVAKAFDGELICADSWTVYKGFDVGTAKPTAQDKQAVPHHLLDIADPKEGFSAVIFKQKANEAIADIHARHKLPVMVGGTGLYIDAVLFDYGFLERGNDEQRAVLDGQPLEDLLCFAEQQNIDLTGIDIRNKRRVVRAIQTNGQKPVRSSMRPNTLVLGIATNREHLRERITQRVDAMLENGLEQEVRSLADQYGWDVEPMKGIGYREWHDYFLGSQDLITTRNRIISATMGLAKRQRTWFKRNPDIQWLDRPEQATTLIESFLSNSLLQ